MGRAPCCDNAHVKKGPWSVEEDSKLKEYIGKYGTGGNWLALPQKVGLKRCGKSCRLRWLNYLRPNLKHGGFSEEEDNIICSLFISIGSRWSIIAAQLPGRTDNDIKNYWNTKLKKKLVEECKDHQTRPVAQAEQESKGMQGYATSAANTRPNICRPQQEPGELYHHMNMGMNGVYSNLGPGITSQLIGQNCGSRIPESSSSSEPVTFQLTGQQFQLDQALSDPNSCLRTLPHRLEGTVVDHHSNNSMAMIRTSSPIQAFNFNKPAQIPHSTAHNQYRLSQISPETSASLIFNDARQAGNHIKLENQSASNSVEGASYESTWMNALYTESNNMGEYGFWPELDYAIMTDKYGKIS